MDEGDGAGKNPLPGGIKHCTSPAELRDFAVITDVDGCICSALLVSLQNRIKIMINACLLQPVLRGMHVYICLEVHAESYLTL